MAYISITISSPGSGGLAVDQGGYYGGGGGGILIDGEGPSASGGNGTNEGYGEGYGAGAGGDRREDGRDGVVILEFI